MKQEEYYKKLKNMILNNKDIKLDLKNGVILDLVYEEDFKSYRAFWKEENKEVGISSKKVIVQIFNGEVPNVELII